MLAAKRAARALGINWADVCEERDRLRADDCAQRDYLETARQIAWSSFGGHPAFWRNGFSKRFGARMARGADYTVIRGHDEIASAVRCSVPEFADVETGELFELLLAPYEPRTSTDALYTMALANVLAGRARVALHTNPQPF
jgi:hypothetical protein